MKTKLFEDKTKAISLKKAMEVMAHFVVFVFFAKCLSIIGHGPWKGSIQYTSYLSGGIMNGYLDHFGKGGKGCLDHNNNSHHMG